MPLVDRPSSSRRDIIGGLVTAALVGIVTLAVTRHPQGPASGGLDSSWGSVLRYAHDHGLDFGTDVVFTYGPLGHANTGAYSGGPILLSSWVRTVITLFVVAPIVLIARRLSWQAGLALLLLVAALRLMRICGLDGLVQAALCCWGLLAFTADSGGPRPNRSIVAICMAMVMCVALVGLAKFSWLLAGGATVCAVAIDLGLRGRPWLAAATIAATGGLWLAGWAALGQPFVNIPAYLAGAWQVAAGYAKAMGTRGPGSFFVVALLATGACAAGVVLCSRVAALPGQNRLPMRRWLLMLWLLGMLFLGWKHGVVRAAAGDTHITALLAQCVVLAFALPIIPVVHPGVERVGQTLGWGVAILALTLAHWMQFGSLEEGVAQTIRRIPSNAFTLARPEGHRLMLEHLWEQARGALALPAAKDLVGTAPVDVFGYSQDYAIANDLNYVPRPVFQSYSVYNHRLAELNDRFYQSPRAPDWVLFELGSIDGRYPGLEDSLTLRTILHDYRNAGTDRQFLVLHRERREPVRLELLASGTARVGERIDVAAHRARDVWLEIDTSPGILARLETFVLRPPPLRFRVWADGFPAEGYAYNAPAPMLATGFIANPVLGETSDAAALLEGKPARLLQAFAIETSARGRDTKVRYRLYAIAGGLVGEERVGQE